MLGISIARMIVIAVLIMGLGVLAVISSASDRDEARTGSGEEKSVGLTDRQVADIVKQYRGEDGKGETLVELLAVLINTAYPNEDILDNPSTAFDWYAFEDFTKPSGIYKVGFIFQTYKDDIEYVWYVDMNTNTIFAEDGGARSVLHTLDTFD